MEKNNFNNEIEKNNLTQENMENSLFVSNIKKQIIPEEWKENIDQILSNELLDANRYFAEINPKLSQLIENESNKTPEIFLQDLRERWEWHNRFYENLLEPALPLFLEDNYLELSLLQTHALKDAYAVSSLVDQATLMMSAAIKKHINKWMEDESVSYLNEKEKSEILTPSTDPFWVQYHVDHLKYIIAKKRGDPQLNEIEKNLSGEYHVNDQKIFNSRLKHFSHYFDMDADDIEKKSGEMVVDDNKKVSQFYLTLERPRLKAIRDILLFDNVEEKKIATTLIGISGFVLRKKILQYLNEANILKNDGKIYEFPDNIILEGLDKLISLKEKLSEKNVKPYQQTADTCGASCLMMAMHYFGESDLTQVKENHFHVRSKSTYLEGNHFSALAKEAARAGLETILVHSETAMFKNEGLFNDDFFKILMKEYGDYLLGAQKYGTKILNGENIDYQSIKKYLEDNYLVLIAGHLGKVLHTVLAVGYNEEGLIVCDPLEKGKEVVSKDNLEEFVETPIGKWILSIRKDHANLENLLNSTPIFAKEARDYIE